MQLDPLNDALVKIYNAEQAGKFDVELTPASKLLGNVLNIMQTSGYICLLYTSPSPRDQRGSRMPSSA